LVLAPKNLYAESNADMDFEDDEEKVLVSVPQTLLPSGFSREGSDGPGTLRYADQDYPLTDKKIYLPFTPYAETFEVRDKKGRIVLHSRDYVGKHLLRGTYIRNHAISYNFGESYSPSKKWKKILFDQTRIQQALDYEYQPGPVGILISLIYQANTEHAYKGMTAEYQGDQQRVALRRLWSPFSNGFAFYRKLHLGLYLGGFAASHKFEYRDEKTSFPSKSHNYGAVAGYDVSHPFAENLWLVLRGDVTWQRIRVKEFDFNQQEFQQGYGLGVKYAF